MDIFGMLETSHETWEKDFNLRSYRTIRVEDGSPTKLIKKKTKEETINHDEVRIFIPVIGQKMSSIGYSQPYSLFLYD